MSIFFLADLIDQDFIAPFENCRRQGINIDCLHFIRDSALISLGLQFNLFLYLSINKVDFLCPCQ